MGLESSCELSLTFPCFYFKRNGNTVFNTLTFFFSYLLKGIKELFCFRSHGRQRAFPSPPFLLQVLNWLHLIPFPQNEIIGILLWECGGKKPPYTFLGFLPSSPSHSLAEVAFSYLLPHNLEQVFLIKTSNKHLNRCPDHSVINITLRQVSLRGKKTPNPSKKKNLVNSHFLFHVFLFVFVSFVLIVPLSPG